MEDLGVLFCNIESLIAVMQVLTYAHTHVHITHMHTHVHTYTVPVCTHTRTHFLAYFRVYFAICTSQKREENLLTPLVSLSPSYSLIDTHSCKLCI